MNFIRLTKRDDLPKSKEIMITVLAVLLSMVFAGIILAIFGFNPFHIFKEVILGAVGTELRIKQTIVKAVPLIITSLGIIVAFKMKFWNIGAEGQITMGALGSCLGGSQPESRYASAAYAADDDGSSGAVRQHMGLHTGHIQSEAGDQRDYFHSDDELRGHQVRNLSPVWPVERSVRQRIPQDRDVPGQCQTSCFGRYPYRMDIRYTGDGGRVLFHEAHQEGIRDRCSG